MNNFKVGDRVKRKKEGSSSWKLRCDNEQIDALGNFQVLSVDENGDINLGVDGSYHWRNTNFELVTEAKTKMDITKFDKEAISEAVKDIDEERLDKQKEKAKDVLREIYSKKDTAEEKKEVLTDELKDINKELNTFTKVK